MIDINMTAIEEIINHSRGGTQYDKNLGSSLFRVANTFEEQIKGFCYPKVKYSQSDFLMNTIRIHEDGRTQQFMQVLLTLPNVFLSIIGQKYG